MSGLIQSGGTAKNLLEQHRALINGQLESRRGRKLYPGDTVEILQEVIRIDQS